MENARIDGEGARSSGWEQRRREILDCAAEVFFERGFARGTTKDIAERVGLTQPAIYHYVGSKEDLLTEIAWQVDRDFTAALQHATSLFDDPEQRLRAVIRSFVETLMLNRLTFAVYWKEEVSLPEPARSEIAADQREYVRLVERAVADAQAAGVVPAGHDVHILSEAIIGMLSWGYWWLRPTHRPDEVADAFCALLGLSASASDGADGDGTVDHVPPTS